MNVASSIVTVAKLPNGEVVVLSKNALGSDDDVPDDRLAAVHGLGHDSGQPVVDLGPRVFLGEPEPQEVQA